MAPPSLGAVEGPALPVEAAMRGMIGSHNAPGSADRGVDRGGMDLDSAGGEREAGRMPCGPAFALGRRRVAACVPEAVPSLKDLAAAVASRAGVDVRVTHKMQAPVHVMRDVIPIAEYDGDAAVYVADLGTVMRRYVEFLDALPRVTPHYAVKCNPDPAVVHLLALLGASFDCASSDEISLVASTGIPDLDTRIIYANPCKQPSQLKHAAEMGVTLMTFDSDDELLKIRDLHPNARLMLRIAVEDSHALCPLSSKYGANMDDVADLLRTAMFLGLNVVGVAFHVGSGCTDVASYTAALIRARKVFNEAESLGMSPLSILDVGGGFPGHDGEAPITFREIATTLCRDLDEMFDDSIRVIAEPGRYFVSAAFSLATQILSCLKSPVGTSSVVIGDGVYGSFKDAVLLNISFEPQGSIMTSDERLIDPGVLTPTTLYGPTCDAMDVVARNVVLGSVVTGDWFYFLNMGAYTRSLATRFNGFTRPRVHYYILPFELWK
jgi:ornithine decarboxylase